VDQVDHGDHDPPWWTSSVQDHLGPRSDISLMKVTKEIMTGTRYIGRELEQIDTSMVQVETVIKGLQEEINRVSGRMDEQDNHQTQHEPVTSHLHQTIQAEGVMVMGRDEQLGQELLNTNAQHQCQLQNHEIILNAMMAE